MAPEAPPVRPARPLVLVDAASLYFRAFFGVPENVRSPRGEPVNAVRGLLDMLATLLRDRRPAGLVACWDEDWRPEFRVRAIPTYKAHRLAEDGGEEVPPALAAQVPLIVEVLEALGVARAGAPGHEADDVIGTLVARERTGRGRPVEVVTGDRDLFQLVDDAAGVRVLYTVRGIRHLDVVDQAWLEGHHGVGSGDAYADMAVLRGDPSDGLPGVRGVGEKTAVSLLRRYGSLAAVRQAASDGDAALTTARRRRLLEAADYLDVAPGVVRVVLDAPVTAHDDAVPEAPADPGAVRALAERWGLTSSLTRVVQALG
ncbi:5'-3' exonuclease [Cellulomonas bogoriensis]|uniref:5'-3' exonuclease n=1 Tax=Cellulomonas bogoriensis 69B4 = DSM 16987 TaxID=1386082 RepID=A0A0A0BZ87_9CELL|nr:5'-3' exonuclease [Cellulomonas bogoriensis]KGM13225.1 5'-3' exonuclease [Cellulomonas bogoriensis 69B4 = DSM 16987]